MRLIMALSMQFKSNLSPHRYRGGKGYEYACQLTVRTENCQSTKHQDIFFFCNFVTSKDELIEKVLPIAMACVRVGRDDR